MKTTKNKAGEVTEKSVAKSRLKKAKKHQEESPQMVRVEIRKGFWITCPPAKAALIKERYTKHIDLTTLRPETINREFKRRRRRRKG